MECASEAASKVENEVKRSSGRLRDDGRLGGLEVGTDPARPPACPEVRREVPLADVADGVAAAWALSCC